MLDSPFEIFIFKYPPQKFKQVFFNDTIECMRNVALWLEMKGQWFFFRNSKNL